jgi:hypothetical protein
MMAIMLGTGDVAVDSGYKLKMDMLKYRELCQLVVILEILLLFKVQKQVIKVIQHLL